MTFSKLRYSMHIYNDPGKRELFDDKARFNKTFADYIHRDWIDVTDASYTDFQALVTKHSSFFDKGPSGMFGKNAGKYDTADKIIEDLNRELKDKGCIIEELIRQSPQLAIFNSTSVNTFRVVTLLCTDDCPKVMAAVLRVGRNG